MTNNATSLRMAVDGSKKIIVAYLLKKKTLKSGQQNSISVFIKSVYLVLYYVSQLNPTRSHFFYKTVFLYLSLDIKTVSPFRSFQPQNLSNPI
jgi:hypothetical protein